MEGSHGIHELVHCEEGHMKRTFRTFNESVAHAGTLVVYAFRPSKFREQMWWDGVPRTWRNRLDYILETLGFAWDALMCGVKGHDMRCAADAESGHTEHWCERCGYSFDVWM